MIVISYLIPWLRGRQLFCILSFRQDLSKSDNLKDNEMNLHQVQKCNKIQCLSIKFLPKILLFDCQNKKKYA